MAWKGKLEKVDQYKFRIPKGYKSGMRVDGIIYASEALLPDILSEDAPEQVANVACLPGIVNASLAMPDIHWGYGFPIGGVAAFEVERGVISPGGVGYDINCGVRLLTTYLHRKDLEGRLENLVSRISSNVPSGVGSEGKIKVTRGEIDNLLRSGARWAVEKGYGHVEDLEAIESYGEMKGADPGKVSNKAKERGFSQVGSLGAGNHFLEVQEVVEIYDKEVAEAFGIKEVGQITILIHTGSRGLGHQVCSDYIEVMQRAAQKYGITLPDRQLACAPVKSEEGQSYLQAMRAATNFAWANRQLITHWVREAVTSTFGKSERELGLQVVYDVAHNVAKIEEHEVNGKKVTLCVHRKGATRAFPAGHPELPERYQKVGQPVLIPGDMGRCSFVLVGTELALKETFGSTCHGAGRVKSRSEAKREIKPQELVSELKRRGILVKAASRETLVEEAPEAYKDVTQVVEAVAGAGISRKVAKMKPLGVIKG
ncbi:MAG: RtcB family protein [Caldiserica bacterium]|jgi:tRNA-splicing ligase RtcB|nr:RtcB family protein [Caldisericota bacterium]MDH7562146.1 RtcB family protein [Caldisericota bacterium]